MLLQGIAKAVLANHPDVVVMVLLVDERPEEVTIPDDHRQVGGDLRLEQRQSLPPAHRGD